MAESTETLAARVFGKAISIATAEALEKADREHDSLDGWAFRGHADVDRGLRTDLDLACARHDVSIDRIPKIEKLLIREFGRKAYLYTHDDQLPDPTDTLEWISLMRHFGAPTRLLDWTYSIFVAAHFALCSGKPKDSCYIWAINTRELNAAADGLPGLEDFGKNVDESDKAGDHFRTFFMAEPPNTFVSTENPYRLNKRLAIQRGVFLCQGNIQKPFLENLLALKLPPSCACQFEIPAERAVRRELGELLYRLNIDQEVLFPGLEGLAKSLRERLPHIDRSISVKKVDIGRIGRAPADGKFAPKRST